VHPYVFILGLHSTHPYIFILGVQSTNAYIFILGVQSTNAYTIYLITQYAQNIYILYIDLVLIFWSVKLAELN